MKIPGLSKRVQALLYAEQHRLFEDELGQTVKALLDAGVNDRFAERELHARVGRHRVAQAFAGPYRDPPCAGGNLVLGADQRGRPARMPLQWLNGHSLCLGSSGSGKTLRSLFILAQLIAFVCGVWAFDCSKREFGKLRPVAARLGIDFLIVPVRRMRINPLQVPDGVDPAEWTARVADLLVQVLELPGRATKLLQVAVHELYRSAGVFTGQTLYPTLFELFEHIRQQRAANPQARQAVLDSLEPVLLTLGPEVLGYRRGWNVGDLARMKINFVLGGVSLAAQNLILATLLLSEFTARIASGRSNCPMDLFIAVDEAQRLLSGPSAAHGAFAALGHLVRGTGIGLDLSIPSGHGLMPEALSFSATKFLGRVGSAGDQHLFGAALGLSPEQLLWAMHNLRPGRFICQVGEGDWRHPFVVDIPLANWPAPSCTEALGPLDGLPVVPSASPSPAAPTVAPQPNPPANPFADEREFRFCQAVVDQPLQPSSVYARLAAVGAQTAVGLRHGLIQKGFIRERRLDAFGRGRRALLLEPTTLGSAAVAATVAQGIYS